MPPRIKRPCTHPGCGVLTLKGGRCPDHVKQQTRERSEAKRRKGKSLYGWRWQKARLLFLEEHPLCRDCEARGRVTPANEVDHIIPHKGNMERFWDEGNWQGLCKSCHSRKTNREDGGGWQRKETEARANNRVFLVFGPSGSGKSTLVRDRAKRGDLILDVDHIFKAVSGLDLYDRPKNLLPVVLDIRRTILNAIRHTPGIGVAWVISSTMTRTEVEDMKLNMNAEVIELRIDAQECKRRLEADTERPQENMAEWFGYVDRWWSENSHG